MKTTTLKLALCFFALTNAINLKADRSPSAVYFQENKGQIHDQYYNSRPDVKFSGDNNGIVFHLLENGLSYQLTKTTGADADKNSKLKTSGKTEIYRVDISWLNSNATPEIISGKKMDGYANYYFQNCPNGVTNVLSYENVTYKNIYSGIDLKWYSNKNELEYDFIVKPGADYKQIEMKISGADLKISNSGDLIIATPFGNIVETAPKVYQEGKLISAKWILENNKVSFDIKNYDLAKTLIIDPVSRVWGTYYGGASPDVVYSTKTDASNNVLIVGGTTSAGAIATVGSHQAALSGIAYDAFLAKFNAAGVRQWATYYGGSSIDVGYGCATDAGSNVYMVGETYSTAGISTAGAHQTANGGATGTKDGFIVKFMSGGTRIWATYYGGAGDDEANGCASDPSGNVVMAGTTGSNTGTIIATTGAHQVGFGGGVQDAFLVKFNLAGTRQWGTYYGGGAGDFGTGCEIDASGNVFMTGYTGSNTGTVIASAGSHQTTYGGNNDAYLVKFNTSGVRQWGTYYGGINPDFGNGCISDASGNIFLTGEAQTTTGTAIATVGGHQATFGGGTNDAYLAKFSSAGVRQWGTYYGGSGGEYGMACSMNAAGDVFITGYTGTTSGTTIATPGSYQIANAGGTDMFLSRFNTSGIRQWGTFYGGTGNDYGYGCEVDGTGNIYVVGLTASSSGISTVGSHQTTNGGGTNDGYLVKFVDCNATFTTSPNSQICSGQSGTLTASGTGITSYSWSTGATTSSITPSPTITTNYTVTANTSTAGCSFISVLTLTVNNNPTLTVSGTNTICSGATTTLTVSGANTYSWSTSATTTAIAVSPTTTTTYSVTGTNTATGCSSTGTRTVTVNATPNVTLTASSASICSGATVTLTASGAATYSWNTTATTSSISISPATTTNYTVTGTSSGCTNTKTIAINVTTTPTVNVSASSTTICVGNTTTITATGATTYSWNTSATTNSIAVSPTVTTSYTVIGNNGSCGNIKTITIVNNTPNLNVSATSTAICVGGSSTLTASGATTYSWSTSATTSVINVSPTGNTIYTVTGTTGSCSSIRTISVNVTSAINLNIASTMSVSCSGAPVVLTASGASSYTWNTGPNTTTISVTPSVSTNYTVNGTSGSCSGSTVITIGVSTNPTISSVTSQSLICTLPSQQSATLTASGATTYSWNTGATTAAITVSPGITTTYTVTGYNAQGCSNTSIITQSVSTCTGVNENTAGNSETMVYPNPSNGTFTIRTSAVGKFEIINQLGQTVFVFEKEKGIEENIVIDTLDDGIYYLYNATERIHRKIIITK